MPTFSRPYMPDPQPSLRDMSPDQRRVFWSVVDDPTGWYTNQEQPDSGDDTVQQRNLSPESLETVAQVMTRVRHLIDEAAAVTPPRRLRIPPISRENTFNCTGIEPEDL